MIVLILSYKIQDFQCMMSPDWSQFWPSIIATVVGFLLALIFQQLIYEAIKNGITNRFKAIKQIRKICDELYDIRDALKTMNYSNTYINPIRMPVWNAILNTNEIQSIADYFELKNKKHKKQPNGIDSVDLYEKLFEIYAMIAEFNEWNNLRANQILLSTGASETAKVKVYETIANLRDLITENINYLAEIEKLLPKKTRKV